MTDTATLQARYEELLKIKHSGVLNTKHGETSATFRTIKEIDQALADLQKQINGSRTRVRYAYQSGKGL